MRSSPFLSACSLLAFALISRTDWAGESSINIDDSERRPAALVRSGQSDFERYPVLTLPAFILASEQSILITSCSRDISRLSMAIVFFLFTPIWAAIFIQNAVFPIAGLPATIIRSEG